MPSWLSVREIKKTRNCERWVEEDVPVSRIGVQEEKVIDVSVGFMLWKIIVSPETETGVT